MYLKKDRKLLFDYDYFGQTCYHWAAKRNYNELLRELMIYGKHVNLYDNCKRTPLHLAASNNHFESAKILLENEASPYVKNINNETPIEVTTDLRIKKLIEDAEKVSTLK